MAIKPLERQLRAANGYKFTRAIRLIGGVDGARQETLGNKLTRAQATIETPGASWSQDLRAIHTSGNKIPTDVFSHAAVARLQRSLAAATAPKKGSPRNSNQDAVWTLHGREITGQAAFDPPGGFDEWLASGTNTSSSSEVSDPKIINFFNTASTSREKFLTLLRPLSAFMRDFVFHTFSDNSFLPKGSPSDNETAEAIVKYLEQQGMDALTKFLDALCKRFSLKTDIAQWYQKAKNYSSRQLKILYYPSGVIKESEIRYALRSIKPTDLKYVLTDAMECEVNTDFSIEDQIVDEACNDPKQAKVLLDELKNISDCYHGEIEQDSRSLIAKLDDYVFAAQRLEKPNTLFFHQVPDLILTRRDVAQALMGIAQYLPATMAKFQIDSEIVALNIAPIFSLDPVDLLNHVFNWIEKLNRNDASKAIHKLILGSALAAPDKAGFGLTDDVKKAIHDLRVMDHEILRTEQAQTPVYRGIEIPRTTLTNVINSFSNKDEFEKFINHSENGIETPYKRFAISKLNATTNWNEFKNDLNDAFYNNRELIVPFIIAAGEWQAGKTGGEASAIYRDLLQKAYQNTASATPSVSSFSQTISLIVGRFMNPKDPLRTRLILLGPAAITEAKGLSQIFTTIGLKDYFKPSDEITYAWSLAITEVVDYQLRNTNDANGMVTTFFNAILTSLPNEAARNKFLELLQEKI